MAQKPSIPKGTRDFSPQEVAKRNYIITTIKKHFEVFGFRPIETPSFENLETLTGKYGEEGDRLIFKILNSGDYLSKVDENFFYNIFRIKEFVVQEYYRLSKILKGRKTKINLFKGAISYQGLESISSKILEEYDFAKETNLEFTQKEKLIKDLIKIYFESDKGGNKELEDKSIGLLIKEIVNDYVKRKSNEVSYQISEKALRYDLTVPFARYVVMHQHEIDFPFKRYQIQPVWRADRPQKGRFREFYQCDADVVGSTSLWQEVEFIQLYDAVFSSLQLNGVTIKLNHRKILTGIAEVIGAKDKLIDFTVALDKLDKIGEEGVKKEMLSKGISQEAITKLQPLFSFSGDNAKKIEDLEQMLQSSQEGLTGVTDLKFIINTIKDLGLKTANVTIDVTLARGLNYYTGAIFEVAAPLQVKLGSIGGGGRYDDLTGIFGLKGMSGIGISFGLDRIYLALEELNLFPETVSDTLDVLFINFGASEALQALKAVTFLRNKGIKADLYPDAAKMKKQFQYANKRNVPKVVLIGTEELQNNTFVLKNMETGTQETYNFSELEKVFLPN